MADFRVTVEGKIKLNGISTVATPSFNLGSTHSNFGCRGMQSRFSRGPNQRVSSVLSIEMGVHKIPYVSPATSLRSHSCSAHPKYILMADAPPGFNTSYKGNSMYSSTFNAPLHLAGTYKVSVLAGSVQARPAKPKLLFRVLICAARTLNRHRSMPGHNRCGKVT